MRTLGLTIGVVALLVASSALHGCSSGAPLAAADLARLTSEPQVLVVHQPPRRPLSMFTTETTRAERIGGFFGVAGLGVGAAKSMSDAEKLGATLASVYGLTDPVTTVEERFIAVAASRGIGTMRAVADPVPSRDASDLKPRFGDATVLVLKTVTWMISYGKDEHRYVVMYRAEGSLVRARDGTVVWEADCPVERPGWIDPATLPTFEQLTANNGELLRASFARKANACAEHLLRLFFGDH